MEVLSALGVGLAIAAVLVVGGVIAGFAVLFQRRGDRGLTASGPTGLPALTRRAGSLLVSLDDAVREADAELGFALAQFGADRARPFAEAVAEARGKLTEAFRLRQQLDDAVPDTTRQQREWTLQIIALSEQAQAALKAQDAEFSQLRSREVDAAATLSRLSAQLEATEARLVECRGTLAELGERYAPHRVAAVQGNPEQAEAALAEARELAGRAASGVTATGVSAVADTLGQAALAGHHAEQALAAVESLAADLAAADTALQALRADTRTHLSEARAQLDKAPDADTGQAIIDAIAVTEAAIAPAPGPADPIAALDTLGEAVRRLDLALAGARNQASRLAHARAAYEGTLVSARSQIAAAAEYIGSRGGGADARTRLAEARRQLMLAEAATDPVEALDTVRRAVTHARDADALARYDTMGRR